MTLLERLPFGPERRLADVSPGGGMLPSLWEGDATSIGAFVPPVDVEETEDGFTLHVELPGVSPDDVEVTVEGDVLTIAGERRFHDEREDTELRRVERHYGRFHRAIRLPTASEPDGAEAHHRDGMLTIHVPKRTDARARRVAIGSGSE